MARHVAFYNLDAIIAVGFRVNSARAIQFRQWATGVLRDFAIRGYVLDKERLKKGAFFTNEYFDNLLAEIREIRASERKFYQKITDIYATAMDEEIRRTNAAIEKHGEEPLSAPTLKHSWYLHPLAGARIDCIRRGVEPYLKAVEESGLSEFFAPINAVRNNKAVANICTHLGVHAGHSFKSLSTSPVVILATVSGGLVECVPATAVRSVECELQKPDNQNKLRSVESNLGRHLFVLVEDHAGWFALNDLEPDGEIGSTGDDVTLWAAAVCPGGREVVCWRALPGEPWRTLGCFPFRKC
ncbi:MAG: hypothetical protein A2341_06495 [Deltaproteobacteria bacterium RIFOXYB12_FULL_58_9]|nr:MAG: hypothetical protein A2341_06495 [Deltaproteobacteria bacterium RIFOXYB12_FULL_58_9]